jgi:hypothetical protein
MSNIWEHPNVIAQEALTHLEDSLIIGALCAKDVTSDFNQKSNGYKVGSTVTYKTHGEYTAKEFTGAIEPQEIASSTRPLVIEKLFDISVEVTATEAAMDLDSFSEQVIKPSMFSLGSKADVYLGSKLLQAQGLYVSNSLFTTAADIALARKAAILQQLSMNRFALLDLDLEADLLGQTWFNQSQTRGQEGLTTLQQAQMGRVMGMDLSASLNFPTNSSAHACGAGTAVTNGGTAVNGIFPNNKIGAETLTIDGGSAGLFNAGDRLHIAGVKRPVIVKTTTLALNTPVTTVALEQPISEVIPDNAAVTVIGSGQSITYHGAIFDDKTLAVAFPILDLPGDKVCAVASNNGVSVRIVRGYDMVHKVDTLSMDFLVGAFMLDTRRTTLLADY